MEELGATIEPVVASASGFEELHVVYDVRIPTPRATPSPPSATRAGRTSTPRLRQRRTTCSAVLGLLIRWTGSRSTLLRRRRRWEADHELASADRGAAKMCKPCLTAFRRGHSRLSLHTAKSAIGLPVISALSDSSEDQMLTAPSDRRGARAEAEQGIPLETASRYSTPRSSAISTTQRAHFPTSNAQ